MAARPTVGGKAIQATDSLTLSLISLPPALRLPETMALSRTRMSELSGLAWPTNTTVLSTTN
jgi:hypothetical protein